MPGEGRVRQEGERLGGELSPKEEKEEPRHPWPAGLHRPVTSKLEQREKGRMPHHFLRDKRRTHLILPPSLSLCPTLIALISIKAKSTNISLNNAINSISPTL